VAFRRSREGNSEICLIDADGSNLRQLTHHTAFDGYPSLFPDGSGVVFASTRSGTESIYLTNIAGTGLTELKQGPEWRAINPRISADGRQVIYAGGKLGDPLDIYKRALTSPLLTIGYQGASNLEKHCEWEEGVLAFGWIQAWRATGDTQYRQWAEGWVDVCVPLRPNVAHVNDGLLGYAALTAYETTQQPEYLDYAERVADYFLHTAPRTSDGTLTHDSHRVWVDTLLSSVPFLTKMSQVSGESLYLEEAISQTVRHAEHLQDPDTGLYRHAWDETGSNPAGQPFWGRGNGWAMMANVTLLSKMPVTHTSRSVVLDSVQRQAAGLQPLQDSSGLWHTVLTRPDSYLETSATMLIGYGLEQGVQHGWLDEAEFSEPTRAARLGVWRRVTADGTVTGVSGPTWPRETAEDYAAIPHGGLRLYGQGLALLLESPR
jgi:unsaturated rhamnogalacturonyl hydrolase